MAFKRINRTVQQALTNEIVETAQDDAETGATRKQITPYALTGAHADAVCERPPRITSYNVCYTKLLRAFEMPLAAKLMAASKNYDALIALGVVIRGETPHFEYVAGRCVTGLSQVSLEFNIPLGFGVLTGDTLEQAIERAGSKAGNKGADAARAAIEMLNLAKQLGV